MTAAEILAALDHITSQRVITAENGSPHREAAALIREQQKRIEELESQRDEYRSRPWELRGVEIPCPACSGSGALSYSNTSTWRHGAGGQAITRDVCSTCWGSGDAREPWTDLRQMKKRIEELEAKIEERRQDDMDAKFHEP